MSRIEIEIESTSAGVATTRPAKIHCCDARAAQAEQRTKPMLAIDTLVALHEIRAPRWYLHPSHPTDGARHELTFIGSNLPLLGIAARLPPPIADALLAVDPQSSLAEMEQNEVFLGKLGDRLPCPPCYERDRLVTSIDSDP